MPIREGCGWISDPGARRLECHKGIVALYRLLLSEALHHGSPDGPCVRDRAEVGRRIRIGVLSPSRAGLWDIFSPKGVGIPAQHLRNAGIAVPEETAEDLCIFFVKKRGGSGSVPAPVDPAGPGRHEADENAVLGSPGHNPVYEGEVTLVGLCHVLIVDGQISIEVGDSGGVVFGQQHSLDHVEALGGAVREVEINVGAIQLVEELPVGVCDPEEGLVALGPVQIAAIGRRRDGHIRPRQFLGNGRGERKSRQRDSADKQVKNA